MKIQSTYTGGISMSNADIRNYRIELLEGEKKGKFLIKIVTTPKTDEFEYGEPEVGYLVHGRHYKRIENAIKKL